VLTVLIKLPDFEFYENPSVVLELCTLYVEKDRANLICSACGLRTHSESAVCIAAGSSKTATFISIAVSISVHFCLSFP
jgi:hypothetical protein